MHGSRPTLDRESVLEWAAWYREVKAGQAKRREARERAAAAGTSSATRARSSWERLDAEDVEDGRWLPVGDAALALGCSESSVLRWARAGLLDARSATGAGGGRTAAVFSVRSIERLKADRAAESEAWVSWEEAARLVGCSVFPIPALIEEGLLVRRPGPHWMPSISRASAVAARVWAERQRGAGRERR